MTTRRRKSKKNFNIETFDIEQYAEKEIVDKFTLWMLRVIVKLNGFTKFIDKYSNFSNNQIAYFLGLETFIEKDEINRKEVLQILKEKYEKIENQEKFTTIKILKNNIKKVSLLMHLNKYEKQILEFTILQSQYDVLGDCSELLGDCLNSNQVKKFLSIILDIPYKEVEKSFSADSKFSKSSLITLYKRNTNNLTNKLELISDEFADNMLCSNENVEYMIKEIISKCDLSELSLNDFNHLEEELSIIVPYLKDSIKNNNIGTNILFYGVPGTGKTELTKSIAKELGNDLFEISYCDDEYEPIEGKKRLSAYKSAQSLLSNKNTILMFDEIEDVFNNDDNPFSTRQNNKAWINRILENNTIPTIWITNNVRSIDNAIVRRFDLAIEIAIPKKKKREEILLKSNKDLLSKDIISKLADVKTIAPALVTRAAKVVSSLESTDKDKAFEMIINNTLKAQGHDEIKENRKESLPKSYNPSYINTSVDLRKLAKGVEKSLNARICLYGPAGTGKSAYGKYISEKLDKKLIIKKGSDLLSMWVGGTEQNIAKAFTEAKEENAVLVFDEVDSFLSDRTTANQSWEVTQVNEMLVQMENFNGIFIATTNLMNNLDKASLRRFDLKLEFSFLEPKQSWKLFKSECKNIKISVSKKYKNELQSISFLTPGDFAAVIRQNRFNPILNEEDFIRRLKDEVEVKNLESSNVMGFIN